MKKIIAINGAYRNEGNTDQLVEHMVQVLKESGADVELIHLRDYPIEFCDNCRSCTQKLGYTPGSCVIKDGMGWLINKIESSDGVILASPTYSYSVTAIFKRFMERLNVFYFWPWGAKKPELRQAYILQRRAVLVHTNTIPGLIHRLFTRTRKQLHRSATIMGASVVGSVFLDTSGQPSYVTLSDDIKHKATKVARRLL